MPKPRKPNRAKALPRRKNKPAQGAAPATTAPVAGQRDFELEMQRCVTGLQLDPAYFDSFSRLIKTLVYGSTFQFILADIRNPIERDRLIEKINEVVACAGLKTTALNLNPQEDIASVQALEERLTALAADFQLIHLCGGDQWLHPEKFPTRWQELNIRRDAIAERCRARLLWWLPPEQIACCATQAPDLWSWRSGVYDFSATAPTGGQIDAHFADIFDNRSLQERSRRAAQLRQWLKQEQPEDIRLQILDELADILFNLGRYDEALSIRREKQLPVYERQGDTRSRAITLGRIADILLQRGEQDEALRIRRDELLPAFEKLGDARSRAVTLGQIADIHFLRGELDEALRIRRNEELPVYEKLGDARSRAIALGNIADALQQRGELDEALRIRRNEELPVHEKLGDARSYAITLGLIADILHRRGELDEALRILQKETLPVFEKLGDARSRAIALGQIADIHLRRGALDEALCTLRDELLPAFEKLGDARSHAIALGKMANTLHRQGKVDEALRILREEALPAYEKLGDIRELVVARANLALLLLSRPNDRQEAIALLQSALVDAQRLRLRREISQIEELLRHAQDA